MLRALHILSHFKLNIEVDIFIILILQMRYEKLYNLSMITQFMEELGF